MPPPSNPGIERFAEAGILHSKASFLFWKIFPLLFFTFLSFLLCSFSQPWSLSVLFPLTCRVGGMGSQAGLATSRQASYFWLCFKKMLKKPLLNRLFAKNYFSSTSSDQVSYLPLHPGLQLSVSQVITFPHAIKKASKQLKYNLYIKKESDTDSHVYI